MIAFAATALALLAGTDMAQAARSIPPVAAACDIADWRAAQVGRAGLPKEVDQANAIIVISGGAIVSSPDPRQAVALLDAAGVDVVNLAQRDLPADPAAMKGQAQFISASFNVAGAPWKSHALVERGGKKFALIGIASRSSVTPLPEGVQYAEPREALQKALKDAGEVDGVILIADAPLSQMAPWQKEFAQLDGIIITGRGGGGPEVTGFPRILRAPPGGQALGILPADASKEPFAIAINLPERPSDAYQQLAQQFGVEPKLPSLEPPKPATQPVTPTALEPNRLTPIGQSAKNRAAVVTVRSAGIFDAFAGRAAPTGRKLLVVDLHFQNTLSPQVVRDQLVPVTYLIPKLTDHLYLVADGITVLRPTPMDGVPGMLGHGELKLPQAGSSQSGKLVYEIDAAQPPRELMVRMYDYAHGSLVLPVLVKAGEATPAEKPVAPLAKNEVLEIGVFALSKSDKLGEQAAPAGMQFVALDLRARSQFQITADAVAFDPKARVGQKTQVGTVADWTDSRKYLQLVVDREYAYVPQPQTTLDSAPRFLPDVLTGGRVVFLAPKEFKSLELRCDMPNAKTPDGKVLRPKGITLALEGKRPPLPHIAKPIATIDDDAFQVMIANQTTANSFAEANAGNGKRFVILDVSVMNRGQAGEVFQTAEQLKVVDAEANAIAVDAATYQGVRRPTEHVWIPAGERRSFQVAYQFDVTETRPRLAYAGVSKAQTVELAQLAPQAAPAPAGPPAGPAKPSDSPVAIAPTPVPMEPAAPAAPPDVVASPAAEPEFIEVDGKRFPARVPIRPNLKPKGIAGFGLTPEKVNAAIDKGSAFLWNHVSEKDMKEHKRAFGDEPKHVLVALALVHSGAHKKFPEFDAHLRKFMEKFDANENASTYEVGLYCMLVESYGDPTYLPQLKLATRWLVENQGPEGSWGYGNRYPDELFKGTDENIKVLRVSGGRPLDGSDVAEPLTRTLPWAKGGDGDNSVSQYALLGLHAAGRSRVKSSPELWQRALKVHAERQSERLGGWSYHSPSSPYGSMTCAGICALALTRHELGNSDPEIEKRIERGLAWMNANFSVTTHPGGALGWRFYYLYSIERVGRILDTEFIGDHEWYPEGASHLVQTQQVDGSWIGVIDEEDPRLASSFALLFLTRATSSLAEPEKSGPGMLKTAVSIPPGRKVYIILDASGSMLEEMDGKPKFEIAREALLSLIQELPPNAELALRAYGYRKRAIEEGASEDSKLIVPMGPIDKSELIKIVTGLRARGKTPLAYSLEQAVGELPQGTEDSPLTVLLLTDGGEDTQPRRDPIAAAAAFAKLLNVRLRIVGFDISREDWSRQLQGMAAASGGQYLPAAKGDELLRELRSALFETPETFTLLDQASKQIAVGKFGESVELPAGKYLIRATYAGRTFEEALWINAGGATAVTFEAARLGTDPGVPASPTAATSPPTAASPPTAQPAAPSPAAPAAPASVKKFCTGCGSPLAAGAKFCTKCGTKVGP